MLTLLLSALIAAPLTGNLSAQADTVNQYIIDGQTVTNFDGTQLIGKSVASYEITYSNEKKKVVRSHIIKTKNISNNPDPFSSIISSTDERDYSDFKKTSTLNPDNGTITETTEGKLNTGQTVRTSSYKPITPIMPPTDLKGKKLYVDDKEVPIEELANIKPSDIQSMTVLKGHAAEAIFGPDATEGVIEITTKKK